MALTALSHAFAYAGLIAAAAFCWQIFSLMNESDAHNPAVSRATTKWIRRSRLSLRAGFTKE